MEKAQLNVLCYGDSNTFGINPESKHFIPHPREKIWVNILQSLLGTKYNIIPAGLGGRTFGFDGTWESLPDTPQLLNGLLSYAPILFQYYPRKVIIMLGTNDVQTSHFDITKIRESIEMYVKQTRSVLPYTKIYFIKPPQLIETNIEEKFRGGNDRLKLIYKELDNLKERMDDDKIHIIDASALKSSPVDGIHLDAETHKQLALLIYQYIA